jgi:hypothetical protein
MVTSGYMNVVAERDRVMESHLEFSTSWTFSFEAVPLVLSDELEDLCSAVACVVPSCQMGQPLNYSFWFLCSD